MRKWKIETHISSMSQLLQHSMSCWKVEQKCGAAIPLVTLWWLNTVCSYQQLLPCITCNYKWPWAADEEPIRFQLACQPKTNYLLALTAGFYLHNSNPSVNWRLRVTHSYEAEMTVYRQVRMKSPAAFQHRETHLINAGAKCDNSRPFLTSYRTFK